MLQLQEYSLVWAIYYVAIVGLLMVTWRLFKGIPWRYLRRLLWITVLVLLATPAIGQSNYWAPAWIIGILELLFGGVESAEPAGRILLMMWVVCVTSYTVVSLIKFLFKLKAAQ